MARSGRKMMNSIRAKIGPADSTASMLQSAKTMKDSHQADHEIVCIDVTAQKFFIYNEKGLLIKRHAYKKQMEDNGYGHMVEASNSGRFFIFSDEENKPGIIHILVLQQSGFKCV